MKGKIHVIAAVLLLALFFGAQVALKAGGEAPAPGTGLLATFGGLRSIVAEVIWFRADRLQDEGRYVELAQLASALAAMDPHTPEVWSYAAWNLAYNVSVMMQTSEDRWRWVKAGIALLRDRGLALNPHSPELHRELAWMFEIKLGADIDDAAPVYRRLWAEEVKAAKESGDWGALGMDVAHMLQIEKATGFDDWTDPQLSAIYWASRGLPYAKGRDRSMLLEIMRQASAIYRKNRKICYNTDHDSKGHRKDP